MELLIDIGNTNTSVGIAAGGRVVKKYFIHTDKKTVAPASLKRLLGADLARIHRILVVSVVPKFLSVMKKGLKAVLPETPPVVIGEDIKVPIKVKYKVPGQVGQDRLVAAYAAKRLYGFPLIVVDFGTAVTFDLVGPKGEYEGGLIFPGLRLALEALVKNAALLPEIELRPATGFIGRDTENSMNKGLIFGYADMCDGIINRFREKYGRPIKAIATGGDAALIAKHSKNIEKVAPEIVFTGLLLLDRI